MKPLRAAVYATAVFADLRAHFFQGTQVQIDRPYTYIATTGRTQQRFFAPRNKRAEKDDGRAHLTHHFLGNVIIDNIGCIYNKRVFFTLNLSTQMPEDFNGRGYIT